MELSQGALTAWQLAAGEAKAARHEQIGPGHLLVGLCSIEKLLMAEAVGDVDMPPRSVEALREEWRSLRGSQGEAGLEPAALRRALRGRLGSGRHEHGEDEVVHRSDVVRGVFDRAGALAGGAATVQAGHLLGAVVEGGHEPVH